MKRQKSKTLNEAPFENIELGKRMRELRIKRGYTSYKAFAEQNNLSRALYGRYENGKDLRFSSLVKIVKALNISLKEFFKDFK